MTEPHPYLFKRAITALFNSSYLKIGMGLFFTYAMVCHADYKKIIEEDFWTKVYPTGGKTFFCNAAFDKKSPLVSVTHIYPTNLIADELGCGSERSCLRSDAHYQKILTDMHNMVAINAFYLFKLKDSVFGQLEDSNESNECGVKKRHNIVEPPDSVKGDVARIHFYMHHQYKMPLDSKYNFLKTWHKMDPPGNFFLARWIHFVPSF